VDADFRGLWDMVTAEDSPITAKLRTGYVAMYAGCLIIWASQLQTEIALSTTEVEYLAMSTALRNTKHNEGNEAKHRDYYVYSTKGTL
jgi:hypothetical protein